MKLHHIILITTLAFASQTYALQSNDQIKCSDPATKSTFVAKVLDIGDEDAYVRIEGSGARFYPSSRVIFGENSEGAYFSMRDQYGFEIEALEIPANIQNKVPFEATYFENNDSRSFTCVLN